MLLMAKKRKMMRWRCDWRRILTNEWMLSIFLMAITSQNGVKTKRILIIWLEELTLSIWVLLIAWIDALALCVFICFIKNIWRYWMQRREKFHSFIKYLKRFKKNCSWKRSNLLNANGMILRNILSSKKIKKLKTSQDIFI